MIGMFVAVAHALQDTLAGLPAPAAAAGTDTLAGHLASTAAAITAAPAAGPVAASPPEEIGLWGLIGVLYPLLLLVGVRLLRIGMGRARGWARRRLDDWEVWLRGAGIPEGRAGSLRRSGDIAMRLAELAIYLLAIYAFSLYFFLLIPGTRELGLSLIAYLWPPVRTALNLVLRTFTYLTFAGVVLLVARWAVPRLRARLGAEVAHAGTPDERERLIKLNGAIWLVRFAAAVLVIAVLPGPGRLIAIIMVALAVVVLLIATRRTLENVAAGFAVGRAAGIARGGRIACDGVEGVVEEWGMTGLQLRGADGRLVHLPYRRLEGAPVTWLAPPGAGEP